MSRAKAPEMGRERRPVPPLVGRPGSTEARRIRDRRTFALPQARGPVDPLSRSNHDGSRLTVAGPLQRGRNLGQQLLEPVNDVLLVVSEVSHERFDGLTDQEQLFASEVNRVHGSTSYVRGSRHGHDCGPGPPDGLQHHLNGWAGLSQPVKSSGFGVRGPDGAPPAATDRDRPRLTTALPHARTSRFIRGPRSWSLFGSTWKVSQFIRATPWRRYGMNVCTGTGEGGQRVGNGSRWPSAW